MRGLILALIILSLAYPALASDISATMDFHASVYGSNVLHPGEKKQVTILLSCEVNTIDLPINENTSGILPVLMTAKSVILEAVEGSDIRVESKSIVVGDLLCGAVRQVVITVDVGRDIWEGTHTLRFDVTYSKAKLSSGNFSLETGLKDTVEVEFEVKKKEYDFDAILLSSNLPAGREGVVKVRITNSGEKVMENAVFILNSTPPLVAEPKGMSVYAGDLEAGKSFEATFKVYVPEGVFQQSYPAEIVAVFNTPAGVSKISKTIGLSIAGSGYFKVEKLAEYVGAAKTLRVEQKSVSSIPILQQSIQQTTSSVITVPSRGYVALRITNTGEKIRSAYALLNFDNPFLQSTSTPFLGDVEKGESRSAVFYITSSAPPGEYVGYLIVKYKDEYGDDVTSPKIYLSVEVKSEPAMKVETIESNLGIGLVGEVKLTFSESKAKKAKLYLLSPDSTITPLTSSCYIDDYSDLAIFRVSVSDEAVAGKHLLYLIETFDDEFAKDLVSVEEFPIYIAPKLAAFQIVSVTSDLKPDSTGEVVIEIKNSGKEEIYNAVVMLEVSPPLSIAGTSSFGGILGQSQPGEFFVGTISPNEVVRAKFRVEVDKDAGEGSYPAAVKVRYYDSSNYEHISNSIVISLEVKPSPPYVLYAAAVFAAIGLAIAAAIVKRRK